MITGPVLKLYLTDPSIVNKIGIYFIFNDGHRPIPLICIGTDAASRRMKDVLDDYKAQIVFGDKRGLNFPIFVLLLKNPCKISRGN